MKIIYYCATFVAFGIVVCLSLSAPHLISDKNAFLKGFVNHEIIAIMGVIITITLASCSQLYLRLSEMERLRAAPGAFARTKSSVRRAAFALICVFGFCMIVVVTKGYFINENTQSSSTAAFLNGLALLSLLVSILVLTSITRTIFKASDI